MENKFLDKEGIKVLWRQASLQDYPNNSTLMAVIDAIDETKADKDELNNVLSKTEQELTPEEIEQVYKNLKLENFTTEEEVEALFKRLQSDRVLRFYCIEDVGINLNGVLTTYPANSNVEVKILETDEFEIVPTSDNSILALNGFPGALGTYYSWLEGVKQFSNILFDMNAEEFYSKWSQGNQGAYQVQFAQYVNCIFWSDNPYIADVYKRTNYTLYNTSQLPLCYSSIPDNTFKAFFLAFGVNNDPNWSNPVYRDSFAKATWATQAFSYYGARIIGVPRHDSSLFNIVLPKDCRGLMCESTTIENAGVFDAINVTNFGAKSGSWRDAFRLCVSLKELYIKNLKVNLNVSWSPINHDSIYFIISNAANTNKITISVSPYTYYLLSDSDFELAASKNITIELLTTNYVEDRRLGDIANKANQADVLLKTEQTLTDEELTQVRKNLKFTGKDVAGQTFSILQDGSVVNVVAGDGAEIFNDYSGANKATGVYAHAEGYAAVAPGNYAHAEGIYTTAYGANSHAEGQNTTSKGDNSHSEGKSTNAIGECSHAEGRGTVASGQNQHVQGAFNIVDTENKYAHIVGNGSVNEETNEQSYSNAHTLDWYGNAWYAGSGEFDSIILRSSTEGSTKKFRITVDDNGNLTTTELI